MVAVRPRDCKHATSVFVLAGRASCQEWGVSFRGLYLTKRIGIKIQFRDQWPLIKQTERQTGSNCLFTALINIKHKVRRKKCAACP